MYVVESLLNRGIGPCLTRAPVPPSIYTQLRHARDPSSEHYTVPLRWRSRRTDGRTDVVQSTTDRAFLDARLAPFVNSSFQPPGRFLSSGTNIHGQARRRVHRMQSKITIRHAAHLHIYIRNLLAYATHCIATYVYICTVHTKIPCPWPHRTHP
ncbi:hypothetical protein BKA81DRAFT_60640 [Phyllosticta paracitricarpa]